MLTMVVSENDYNKHTEFQNADTLYLICIK